MIVKELIAKLAALDKPDANISLDILEVDDDGENERVTGHDCADVYLDDFGNVCITSFDFEVDE